MTGADSERLLLTQSGHRKLIDIAVHDKVLHRTAMELTLKLSSNRIDHTGS